MVSGTKNKEGRGGIQSLERAAAILDVVAASHEGAALADVTSQTGLHTSTAFHLLKTLTDLNLISQDEDTRRYHVGSRVFTLAAGALDDNLLLRLGQPILNRLSEMTGESAHLAVRSRLDIVLVARTAASGMLQMSERAGLVRPAHATAIGKVLLAHVQPEEQTRLVDELDLRAFTPQTITRKAKLRTELETVRRTGVAHDRCEFDGEVRCVALPVFDFAGRCVAAIGISGPVWRMSEAKLKEVTDALAAASSELSTALGYSAASVAE